MTKVLEPDIVVITAGPVTLGVPEPPMGLEPHSWVRRHVDVPAFGIAKYAVTVAEYLGFADATGYAIADELRSDPRFVDPQAPAGFVSWVDAVRYVQWLGRQTAKPYRLLRDAEYEKAARGGLEQKRFPWGDEPPNNRTDFANPNGSPRPVGSFAPNGFGLYDMVGSIWSWCEECYDQVVAHDRAKLFYEDTAIKDPRLNPICRGGSFKSSNVGWLHCAYRHEDPMEGREDCIGVRVALSLGS